MTDLRAIIFAAVTLFLVGCSPVSSQRDAADIVLQNGSIYTVDKKKPWAEAVAIDDGHIVFVGSSEDANAFISESTRVIDLDGKMVMPGLFDTHIHAMETIAPDMCDLDSRVVSLDEMVPILKSCIESYDLKQGDWLNVLQWSFSIGNKPSEKHPTLIAALDAVSSDHPIMLHGDDGHHAAANTLALEQARDREGKTVPITKDSLQSTYRDYRELIASDSGGNPTGGITETARALLQENFSGVFIGIESRPEDLMPKVAQNLAASGITSIFDPFVGSSALDYYDWLEKSGHMTFRVRAALVRDQVPWITEAETPLIPADIERFKADRKRFQSSELIEANAVKLFADAVLEGNPYTDPPTAPVAAMLNGFKRPQFTFDPESGELISIGYVDPDSDICKSVRSSLSDYQTQLEQTEFKELHGFLPKQCVPYYGILEHEDGYINSFVRQMTEAGFHVHIHAIGDTAVRKSVDAFAAAKSAADKSGLTQSLVHMQVIHPDDQTRLGALGIFASFTFLWNKPELEYELMVVPFIDEVRSVDEMYDAKNYYIQNAYPAKSLIDAGAIVMGGSDAPVGSRDPLTFVSMEQALNRSDGRRIINADERLSIAETIAAFTINGAKFFGRENELGSLEVGKTADLIVLDRNIVELANVNYAQSVKIKDTQVLMTIFNGRIVFEK